MLRSHCELLRTVLTVTLLPSRVAKSGTCRGLRDTRPVTLEHDGATAHGKWVASTSDHGGLHD